jgi:LacI family transcriptional regulator
VTKGGRPTLETVAVAAGVSLATVSKVLNDRLDVAPTNRIRVQRLLDQYEYVPPRRPTVSRFAEGRQLIELVFTALDSPYSVEILRGVTSGPVDVVVSSMPDPSDSRPWSSGLASAGRSGAIIVTSELTPSDQRSLARAHVPYVVIDPAAEQASAGVEVDPALIRNGNFHHIGGYRAVRAVRAVRTADRHLRGRRRTGFRCCRSGASHWPADPPEDLSVVGFDDLPISR